MTFSGNRVVIKKKTSNQDWSSISAIEKFLRALANDLQGMFENHETSAETVELKTTQTQAIQVRHLSWVWEAFRSFIEVNS